MDPAVLGRDVFLGGHVVEDEVEEPERERGVRLASLDSSELADAIVCGRVCSVVGVVCVIVGVVSVVVVNVVTLSMQKLLLVSVELLLVVLLSVGLLLLCWARM